MSLLYREKDQNVYREYCLLADGHATTLQTKRALVEIVDTKEYGPMFFIDGVLQMAAVDEYIYHEFLVHPAMMYSKKGTDVCILGGGDGCAAREVLKWKSVNHIDLYDWDAQLVDHFRHNGKLWNHGSLQNERVAYVNCDISQLFGSSELSRYDTIIIDLLDPEYPELQKEHGFWEHLLDLACRWRKPGGSIVINGGGVTPWQNGCFSLLKQKCRSNFPGLAMIPYKAFVPSFGREWAFLLICDKDTRAKTFPPLLRRFSDLAFQNSFLWESDFKIEG